MKHLIQILSVTLAALILTACGEAGEYMENYLGSPNQLDPDAAVVKARAVVTFSSDERGRVSVYASENTLMTATLTEYEEPSEDDQSIGSLRITNLEDQNLDLCDGGARRCENAYLRVYANGGHPFIVRSHRNGQGRRVGFDSRSALILEATNIPEERGQVSLVDFDDTEFEVSLARRFRPHAGESVTLYVEYVVSH